MKKGTLNKMINKTFFCLFLLLSINTYGQFKADSTYISLNVATSRVSAGIDGSLYLLSNMFNMGVANDVAKIMMYNWKSETLDYIVTPKEDTLFEKRISAFTWMPDGKDIILNVLKVDRAGKTPPMAKKFRFNIKSETIEPLPIDGGGLVASPDGLSVAYIKQVNGKDQIYIYNFLRNEDKLLVDDTLRKYAISWSPDGKNIVYNIQTGRGANAKVEMCTYHFKTNQIVQITINSPFKRYTPNWNTKNDEIVYTAEKGDKRDQIYLTDKNGSYHTNLTNDTTTHNYAPLWKNEKTIMYIQSPGNIMTMKIDGSQKQRIEGINTIQFKYNPSANRIVYLDAEGELMIADLKGKTKKILIKQNQVDTFFSDKYFNK
ncbi:MAG: PD40 domain-containing protein [Haliscomenobacter sp.]|nr:PD40 domain-containing protein [Haliscomenobacter sp.]